MPVPGAPGPLGAGHCLKVCEQKRSCSVIAGDALSFVYRKCVEVGAGIIARCSPGLSAVSWEFLTCWEDRSNAGVRAGARRGNYAGLKAGPHWQLVDQTDDSERREIKREQGGFYACTTFPSISAVHHWWLSIKILCSVKNLVFLCVVENRSYMRLTYFQGSALSVYSSSVKSNAGLKPP